MERREFCKGIALVPTSGAPLSIPGVADAATSEKAEAAGSSQAGKTAGSKELPEYAKNFLTSDMDGLGPDGKPTGIKATFTGASQANTRAEQAMQHKMKLTEEEQAILDGKEGEERVKLMKILVQFGNTFGAEKLVDLGGAPQSPALRAEPLANVLCALEELQRRGVVETTQSDHSAPIYSKAVSRNGTPV